MGERRRIFFNQALIDKIRLIVLSNNFHKHQLFSNENRRLLYSYAMRNKYELDEKIFVGGTELSHTSLRLYEHSAITDAVKLWCTLSCDHATAHSVEDGFCPAGDAEFVKDVEQVVLYRMFAEMQGCSHFAVRKTFSQQVQDLFFSRA